MHDQPRASKIIVVLQETGESAHGPVVSKAAWNEACRP